MQEVGGSPFKMVTDGNYNKGGGKRDNLNMTIGNAHAAASNDYQDVSIY